MLQQSLRLIDAAKFFVADADDSRQFYNSLVYCQSLILLAAASDRPESIVGASTSSLLGQIAGYFNEFGIHDPRKLNYLEEHDQELFQTARRVFWTAFILDRFHAPNRPRDFAISLLHNSPSREDFNALGEVGYHVARKKIKQHSRLFTNDT